ncbi:MAG: phosphoribosylamine--glycine ligase [Ignavibacteriales bacterium]|nr:phosphoribosylamine--glycine ligase [Ignavibacteriales bacterium]
MNVLVIGSGGREHALVWKLRQSPTVNALYCAPGNAGIGETAELVSLKPTDLDGLLRFAKENNIDLTIVGPEQPLVLGIVDMFRKNGLKIFGPSKAAAALEGSKVFAKDFMARHGIPTARFRSFSKEEQFEAERFIHELAPPIVVKADGLAAGKGVLICNTKESAIEALHDLMVKKMFGSAGEKVVIEEYLVGEEASVFAITDGEKFVTLASAQDHKRILDNDQGKNTGGMGAYAPASVVDEKLMKRIVREVITPTLKGMMNDGVPYQGCLYCGLMITETGPKVIEYNCRLGDPEAQVVIPLIDGDLAQLLLSAAEGKLNPDIAKQHPASAVCVVMASRGYPDDYETGKEIRGLDTFKPDDGVVIFHAGTRSEGKKVLTSGGRVLGVTAIGYDNDLRDAIQSAYRAVSKIAFDGAYYRSDIGKKGLSKLQNIK